MFMKAAYKLGGTQIQVMDVVTTGSAQLVASSIGSLD